MFEVAAPCDLVTTVTFETGSVVPFARPGFGFGDFSGGETMVTRLSPIIPAPGVIRLARRDVPPCCVPPINER